MEQKAGEQRRVTLIHARNAKWEMESLLRRRGISAGVGVTRAGEDYALKVNLNSSPPESVTLPEEMKGVAVLYEVIGTIRPGAA